MSYRLNSEAVAPAPKFGNRSWTEDEMTRIQHALKQNLSREDIAKRRGPGGTTLTYVEGWKVFEIANDCFGIDGWSCCIKSLMLDYPPEKIDGKYTVSATALVTVTLKNGTTHEDVGCGNGRDRNKFAAIESAKKQAVTDARKRALRLLGPRLGNCLYDKQFKAVSSLGKAPAVVPSFVANSRLVPAPQKAVAPKPGGSAEATHMKQHLGKRNGQRHGTPAIKRARTHPEECKQKTTEEGRNAVTCPTTVKGNFKHNGAGRPLHKQDHAKRSLSTNPAGLASNAIKQGPSMNGGVHAGTATISVGLADDEDPFSDAGIDYASIHY